jgi:hypothetical protein
MKTLSLVTLTSLGLAAAANAAPMVYEEQIAHAEEALILTSPVAGIKNRLWFDYRNDVGEAQKELASDLRRASDLEDARDAWEEYAHELKHERIDYIEAMAKRGYRLGTVTIVN